VKRILIILLLATSASADSYLCNQIWSTKPCANAEKVVASATKVPDSTLPLVQLLNQLVLPADTKSRFLEWERDEIVALCQQGEALRRECTRRAIDFQKRLLALEERQYKKLTDTHRHALEKKKLEQREKKLSLDENRLKARKEKVQ
jgi:hypothetical protein